MGDSKVGEEDTPTDRPRDGSEPGGSELRADTLELLDFQAIREEVAGHAAFPPARRLAVRLEPAYDEDEVAELQRETAEGLIFIEEAGDVDLHAVEDASPAVARAALQGVLTGPELLAVTTLLDVQQRARSALLMTRSRTPLLAGLAEGIPDLQHIRRRTLECIGRRGEVLDAATPALGALRQQVREAYQRVAVALDGVINSPTGLEALQDRVISMRGERLVVQVKTEMRQRVPGVVHDASNTGATLFIEPFATIDLCNEWRELALEEERETSRVLRELSELVGAESEAIGLGTQLTARLDFILARARHSASLGGVPAQVISPTETEEDGPGTVRLLRARHPLLGKEVVPVSVQIGPGWSVLVITGPNTGGKTVAMKTVGLLALMHQAGLQIPAEEGSALRIFDGIYADVGDQQSIEQSVSTFGSHMRKVIDIISRATPASLVLLDELGTSTDPEEGSALAKAILGRLASRGVATIATTHHRTVAAHAEVTPGMTNASVDLDADTLMPTYHLTLGVPGRSYAMSVAARLGLPDEIMEEARTLLEPQHLRFEDWLNELQNDRRRLRLKLDEADEAYANAERIRREVEAQREDLALRREEIAHGMRRELAAQYEQVRRKLRRAEAALSWDTSAEGLGEAGAEITSAKKELKALERRAQREAPRAGPRPLATGDVVDVRGLDARGTVMSINDQVGEVEVAIGDVRIRLDVNRLSPAQEQDQGGPGATEVGYDLGPGLQTLDLDVRGSRADDALIQLEVFLDKALRDGLSTVRIIHGRGTGALRQAVRDVLSRHPLAKSFAPEAPDKGGDGVTVVELM
jgi:DNA mismatch repair protein MutS2